MPSQKLPRPETAILGPCVLSPCGPSISRSCPLWSQGVSGGKSSGPDPTPSPLVQATQGGLEGPHSCPVWGSDEALSSSCPQTRRSPSSAG